VETRVEPAQEQKLKTRLEELNEKLASLVQQKHELEMDVAADWREQGLEHVGTCIAKIEKQIESETQDVGVKDQSIGIVKTKEKTNPDIVLGIFVAKKEELQS
jgi:hypothetical protein